MASLVLTSVPHNQAYAQQITDQIAPESATPNTGSSSEKSKPKNAPPTLGEKWMVSAANPYAARIAANILRQGGSASDAAIAAQFVLGLVEPQSSGLGGGAFLVRFDAVSKTITTLDGRETAPKAATLDLFQDGQGNPLKFFDAVIGGRSVGVPGTPALLYEMHERWGTLLWSDLITPAMELAKSGFTVSPRLASLIEENTQSLALHPETSAYFLPENKPLRMGDTRDNPAYADTLRLLQEKGMTAFYKGPIAQDIVDTVEGFKPNPGVLTKADLNAYLVKERAPICSQYREYSICGMGPPSSGALTVGQILGMLENFDLKGLGPENPQAWRLIGDASRLAFADRGRYMADEDFVRMPTKGLLAQDYLKLRARLLNTNTALKTIEPGEPKWDHAALQADDEALELPSTTHFSIVDARGNIISMTSTIENAFGSRLMTNGFLLNNELTDFSFIGSRDGKPIANRVQPGKRPRSSMAPTIVLKDGKPVLAIGSPGGSRIIGYVAKTIISVLDWKMDIQRAISSPHLVNRFGTYDLEKGTSATQFAEPLGAMGFQTNIRSMTSGLHGIFWGVNGLEGGADPRREGIVISDTLPN